MAKRSESILTTVRTHGGVFIPAVVITAFLTFGTLPFLFLMKVMSNFAGQLGSPTAQPTAAMWFVLVPDMIICAIVFSAVLYAYKNSTITLTNQRLIFSDFFASRLSGELPLENIEAVFIFSPLLGGLFGYGTVTVTTIGGKVFPMRFLASPNQFHSALQKAIADAKNPPTLITKSATPSQDLEFRYMPKS